MKSLRTNSIGMDFVYIESGTFLMGSPENELGRHDGEILHPVTISKGFYMQTTPVTQGQWKEVMGNNPSLYNKSTQYIDRGYVRNDGTSISRLRFIGDSHCGDNNPVERVSWHDAQNFLESLNKFEGTTGYRLPTEAEWEYACRAGTDTPFSFGNCLSTDQANFVGTLSYGDCPKGIKRKTTTAVKKFPANPWGIYDMHGNVCEWCQDWAGKFFPNDYSSHPVADPKGPISGTYKITRGGVFWLPAQFCRSATRFLPFRPAQSDSSLGFRVVKLLA